jgi:hypothetical protein
MADRVKLAVATCLFTPELATDPCLLLTPIVLQKSKVASVRIFGETLKRETIDDSDSLSRAIEVADEFSVKR